jgi:hypothetical protein
VTGAFVCLSLAYWWYHGGEYHLLVALQPEFRVSEIDAHSGTMTIENANEGFLVLCQGQCAEFTIGGKYRLLYRGAFMEYRSGGRSFQFRIIRQHVNFDVIGGRG